MSTPDKSSNILQKGNKIKLDGTIIKSDGTTYKSNFFKFLELSPDDYSDITFTAEEANRIRGAMCHLSTGASAAIPLICSGLVKCPFTHRCPIAKEEKRRKQEDPAASSILPIGRACLVELNLINEWTRLYVEEYDIDENSFTEFEMVRELAEIELMLTRLNYNLCKPENAELVQDVVVGVDREGNPLTRKETNALFEAKERLNTRKSRIIKLMVGDRQEKYKEAAALKTSKDKDPSKSSADLRRQIETLQREMIALKEKEGKLIDVPIGKGPLSPDDLISLQTEGKKY